MTLSESMDGQAFEVFIQHFLVPNSWDGAVVVMDNLPAHKLAVIEPRKKRSKHWWQIVQMLMQVELCELFAHKTGNWVSRSAMCRCAAEIRINSQKKT